MSYHVYLFRKEVKEQNEDSDLSFLENEDLILDFTEEQFNTLKTRLLAYGFQIENEQTKYIQFNFKGGLHGIQVNLSKSTLSFISGFSEQGIFEISMTASEFTDTGVFAKLDPQAGVWEID